MKRVFYTTYLDSDDNEQSEPRWGVWFVVVIVAVVVLFKSIAQLHFDVIDAYLKDRPTYDPSLFGVSGDFFGFTNAVFSALAFAMIILTLWMQKYELSQQRKEIDQTQDIMSRQLAVMQRQENDLEAQSKLHRQQAFESTFFAMLRLFTDTAEAIVVGHGNQIKRGRMAIAATRAAAQSRGEFSVKEYSSSYTEIFEPVLGHYFRVLYNLVSYVDQFGSVDTRTYMRLVRAQLCSVELELLAVNGLSEWGVKKFKPLIEKYSLLKHIPRGQDTAEIRGHYSHLQ